MDLLEKIQRDRQSRKLDSYYPDQGPLRRDLYRKHVSFFAAGGQHDPMPSCPNECDGSPHRERCVMAGNRVGKTEGIGGFEVACHLTGQYPRWWPGKRFHRPVRVWASGDTAKTTRNIIQQKLIGPHSDRGTGLIPKDCIVHTTSKQGVADALEIVHIRHITGGNSELEFKSYDQRREGFQGTEMDVVWLDEEPPEDIYTECLVRTMTNHGIILLTFTPLKGFSDVVLSYLPGGTHAG